MIRRSWPRSAIFPALPPWRPRRFINARGSSSSASPIRTPISPRAATSSGSNSVSQADEQPRLAKYAADLGFKGLAVLYLNTDWGRQSQKIFSEAAKGDGLDVVASEAYQPDEKDFRSTLVRVRDAKPDAIVLISYSPAGDLIPRQIRTVGLSTPIVASGSIYSPKFIELAGDAANGVYPESNFFPGDKRPEVQGFVTKFRAKYNEEPDDFNAVAYDTITLLAAVINQYGVDRTAIRDGLAHIKDVPSVIYGKATFGKKPSAT